MRVRVVTGGDLVRDLGDLREAIPLCEDLNPVGVGIIVDHLEHQTLPFGRHAFSNQNRVLRHAEQQKYSRW